MSTFSCFLLFVAILFFFILLAGIRFNKQERKISLLEHNVFDLMTALTQSTQLGDAMRGDVEERLHRLYYRLGVIEAVIEDPNGVDEVISASDLIAQASESRAPSVEPRPARVLRGNGT